MRPFALVAALLLCATHASTGDAQTPAEAAPNVTAQAISTARADFIQLNPRIKFHESDNRLTRVYGVGFANGASPTETADSFRSDHARIFGVAPADLLPISPINTTGNTQGVMFNSETNTYKFTLVYYSQYHAGIPVFESDLRILVRNTGDYPAVLAAANLRPLEDFEIDPTVLQAARDFSPATRYETELTTFTKPQTVIWAGVNNQVATPRLAIAFTGDNYDDLGADVPLRHLFVVDPVTAEVLYQRNLINFTDITGSVSARATEGSKADYCNDEPATANATCPCLR